MSASAPADETPPSCEWMNHGHHDWLGRGPNGESLVYEGRLCVAGVVATGLRDLRYVKGVRTCACRPGLGHKP